MNAIMNAIMKALEGKKNPGVLLSQTWSDEDKILQTECSLSELTSPGQITIYSIYNFVIQMIDISFELFYEPDKTYEACHKSYLIQYQTKVHLIIKVHMNKS